MLVAVILCHGAMDRRRDSGFVHRNANALKMYSDAGDHHSTDLQDRSRRQTEVRQRMPVEIPGTGTWIAIQVGVHAAIVPPAAAVDAGALASVVLLVDRREWHSIYLGARRIVVIEGIAGVTNAAVRYAQGEVVVGGIDLERRILH